MEIFSDMDAAKSITADLSRTYFYKSGCRSTSKLHKLLSSFDENDCHTFKGIHALSCYNRWIGIIVMVPSLQAEQAHKA